MMQTSIPTPLKTQRAPSDLAAPWLTGRGPRRMVSEDWLLQVDGLWYCVPAGYIFDGASIPAPLWWLFPPGYDPAWEASAFHDFCYSHLYRSVTKAFADDAFRAIMLKSGASPTVAGLFHWAVRRFGRGGW